MAPTNSSFRPPNLLLFVSFFLLFSFPAQAGAFNITRLLSRFPEFSTFNSYLTQTNVSIGINRRQTITVLAVENGAMSPVTGKSLDDIKNILRLHVILDYYDLAKLHKLTNDTALVTTLFQASGLATGQQGFLNVTELSSGDIVFGSAEAGSPLRSRLIKPVASQPFNISVLQISTPVLVIGVGGVVTIPPSPPPPSGPPAPAPGPGAAKDAPPPPPPPAPAPSTRPPAKAPSAGAPAPSDDSAETPAPAPAPAADGPVADGPAGEGPASSPLGPVADGPNEDTPTRVDPDSRATKVAIGTYLAAVIPFMSILFGI